MKIGVIHYGVGNIGSIVNMVRKIGHEALLINTDRDLDVVTKLILPGIGAFDSAMQKFNSYPLKDKVMEKVTAHGIPTLGVCVGMQMLFEKSEEGELQGLGWLKGQIRKFQFPGNSTLKTPHMGWNKVSIIKENPLVKDMESNNRFYFVHSFFHEESEHTLATCNYGNDFSAIVASGNIYGTQFHPEKSHRFGMQLLSNFIERC